MQFENRTDAGRRLGRALLTYAGRDVRVVGLPRGGVPVAFEVADMLAAPLDVWVVRKLGVPFQPELGMGAVAEGPALVLDRDLVGRLGISSREVMEVVRREADEVRRRVSRFRGERPPPDVEDRTVLVVDDGIATGGTTRAAIKGLRKRGARQVVLAVPVASPQVLSTLQPLVDDLVCLSRPRDLIAIGVWYEDFRQVSDAEVSRLLDVARRAREAEVQAAPAHGAGAANPPV
jgi:putative phosphoribosyl transferase